MKVFGVVLVLILGANSVLSSQGETWEDGWLALGANFGNYFQNDADLGGFYAGSLGVNFSGYGFWNHKKNIGVFFNHALLLPHQNPLAVNTIDSNYNKVVSSDFLVGPGFRHKINDKLQFHYGIGLNISLFNFLNRLNDDDKFTDQRYSFGIGGDVGLKYDITDVMYLNIGTTLNFNFANYRVAESTADNWANTKRDSSGWINSPMFGIRPYFAVGVNFYSRRAPLQWGKPN